MFISEQFKRQFLEAFAAMKKGRCLQCARMFVLLAFLSCVNALPAFTAFAEPDNVPVVARQSGPWSATTTWEGDRVPGASDDVLINPGQHVTYDAAAPGTVNTITLEPGDATASATLTLERDLQVTTKIWARDRAVLDLNAFTLSGGVLRIGSGHEQASLEREEHSRIKVNQWMHYHTSQTLMYGDRIENLTIYATDDPVTFSTIHRFNVTQYLRLTGKGNAVLELGDDLDVQGLIVMQATLKDNGYNVYVKGRTVIDDQYDQGYPYVASDAWANTTRGGGSLTLNNFQGRSRGAIRFRGGDKVSGDFDLYEQNGVFPSVEVTQDVNGGGLTSGLSLDDEFASFYLDSESAANQAVMTLNWDAEPLDYGCDWTLRWKGNNVGELRAYYDEGQIVIGTLPKEADRPLEDASFDIDTNLFYDVSSDCDVEQYTYFGYKTRMKEVTDPALPDTDSVPQLERVIRNNIPYEGPTNYETAKAVAPTGDITSFMIFVQLCKTVTGTGGATTEECSLPGLQTPRQAADAATGFGKLQSIMGRASYGKLTLHDMHLVERWEKLDGEVTDYVERPGNLKTGTDGKSDELATESLALYTSENLVGNYDFGYVVLPRPSEERLESYDRDKSKFELIRMATIMEAQGNTAGANQAYTSLENFFNWRKGDPIPEDPQYPGLNQSYVSGVPGRSVPQLAVLTGLDAPNYMTTVHETGHVFGLPDLYPLPSGDNLVGPWAIMSQVGVASGFLGWHRHKMEWLDSQRGLIVKGGEWAGPITQLSKTYGISMVVLPKLPAGSRTHPTRYREVYVIEIGAPIKEDPPRVDYDDKPWDTNNKGVLIYLVDASLGTGQSPIKLQKRTYECSAGPASATVKTTREAALGAGQCFQDDHISVEVVREIGADGNKEYFIKAKRR